MELAMEASCLPIHVVALELPGRNAGWVTAACWEASAGFPLTLLQGHPDILVRTMKFVADREG